MPDPKFVGLQRELSQKQRFPIVGVIPSIIKLVVAIVQLLWSIVQGVAAGCGVMCTGNRAEWTTDAGLNCFTSIVSFGYAIANIATLSFLGWVIESFLAECNC
jgi:hypothetical protein